MSEWQPIETAPKDGTDVLLFRATKYRVLPPTVAGWFDKGVIPGWYTYDEPDKAFDGEPTHWMPLPAPPSLQPASEQPTSKETGE